MATQEHLTRTPRTFKCPEHRSETSRRLVVCIDGTSNQFGTKNTNIVELYRYITKSDTQLTYYSSGLGTIAKVANPSLGHRLSSELDMAIGRNLHKVIMASYRWLSDNYKDGDSIFLFGYSRGAYQVRALAGMIAQVGLLLPGNNEQIPFAFELYSKTDDDDSNLTRPASVISRPVTKESKKKAKYTELAKTFRKTFCRSNVHIHFVGVWDTVSSVGFGRSRTLPCTTTSCEHICYFRHALALDERRVKFLPEYVYGGQSSYSDDGRVKEVWFAGCHADVGGGHRRNERLQSGDIPLLWMRSQAIAAGLKMEPADVVWKIDDLNKRITRSLNPGWWLLELLPLKRLLYYNSDRHTFRPHFGGPRRILPGQKVHVSALFKNNYKPYARFYNNPEGWPEPMFWNDATSHQRLQELSKLWEKDIFDERSVETLLDDLKRGQLNLDALDRLAFMANLGGFISRVFFRADDETYLDIRKNATSIYNNAEQVLATFLKSKDRLIRLSTAVTYCELGWDWPLETTHGELGQQITEDVSELLKSGQDCRRACMYIPSLCKRTDLRAGLMSEENLKMLVQLCDNTRVIKREEGTSTVAFYSAQALSMLMKCDPVLVSVLSVVDGLAKDGLYVPVVPWLSPNIITEGGRAIMKSGPIVATLLKLVKQSDDFVAPAATRVLCSLLPEGLSMIAIDIRTCGRPRFTDDLRGTMLQFGVLSTFLDMLDRCSDETKTVARGALVEFAQHDDIRRVLSQGGYLGKIAKRVQSHVPSERDGAITALVALGTTQGARRMAVIEAIKAAKTIHVLVTRLSRKSTALPAASALARLVRIDSVVMMVSDDETGAGVGIVGMLQRRWFDGLRGEDGLQALSELLECERLRSAVLKAGAIDVLRKMVDLEYYENTYASLHYLRVFARFGRLPSANKEGSTLPSHDTRSLVIRVSLSENHILVLGENSNSHDSSYIEDLRALIVEDLLGLLKDRHAGVVFAVSALLGFLAAHGTSSLLLPREDSRSRTSRGCVRRTESVRDRVLKEESFWNLSHEYYDGLKLKYDEMGRGPRTGASPLHVCLSISHFESRRPRRRQGVDDIVCTGEVYEAVGHMIKVMQVPESDEVGATGAEDRGADEKRWLARVPYELKKENTPSLYWIATLLCCPPLLLCGVGQRMYRELWQEG
ncbi:hypothetical protein J3R83DRAFT_10997 [Lanmaoa asiatica]|nr:hypothetical protein J3R83DRAFT_10997 [Lanmaoa asiatica]